LQQLLNQNSVLGVTRQPAGRAFHCNPSLRAERGNLFIILHNKLATPGFPLPSLTQLEVKTKNQI
jgi:hypothetical protein